MPKLSENYYLRQHYLQKEQVPTQTVMKEKMTPNLANVYFKSMTPKLKVLAGLEPPMKGGGSDWYVPPMELLAGRAVMKPEKHEHLKKLGFNGIDFFGEKLIRDHHREMEKEKLRVLQENDINWKRTIEANCSRQWDETSREQSKENTEKIQEAFHEFTTMYSSSITKIESILLDAAINEIKRVEKDAFNKMTTHYETLLKRQATMLYDRFAEKLLKGKTRHKNLFISKVEKARTTMSTQLHDINVEKHIAIERLRALLQCQNLACQIYVALKEREACKKDIELSTHKHKKIVKTLTEQIQFQDFEIKLAKVKEKKRQEFIKLWKKKICHVVKKFQDFVMFCLNTMPEHAEFFINMEKLLLLQLSEAIENPSAESIFEPEEKAFHTPIPRPHPFFLFCDKGYKPKIDETLCPKHCTSSASQFPVIVVNKKYIYSACDNFEKFTQNVKQFLDGQRGNDVDFIDDHDYTFDIPVKYAPLDPILELKLESSLMQVLQNELPNLKDVDIECCVCKTPTCFCPKVSRQISTKYIQGVIRDEEQLPDYGHQIDSRDVELQHEREPKWESYMQYVLPKRCECAKRAKKHLVEHLPPYMRNMSAFDVPDLPNYKPCTLDKLKKLVKTAQRRPSPVPTPVKAESNTRTVATQYSDQEYEYLCNCFSDAEIDNIFQNIIKGSKLFKKESESKFEIVDGSLTPTYLKKEQESFIQERAHSLRRLMNDAPELVELFQKEDCNF